MSAYVPDPSKLYAAQRADGWWLMDQHGPLDGPYASEMDVIRVIRQAVKEGR